MDGYLDVCQVPSLKSRLQPMLDLHSTVLRKVIKSRQQAWIHLTVHRDEDRRPGDIRRSKNSSSLTL